MPKPRVSQLQPHPHGSFVCAAKESTGDARWAAAAEDLVRILCLGLLVGLSFTWWYWELLGSSSCTRQSKVQQGISIYTEILLPEGQLKKRE